MKKHEVAQAIARETSITCSQALDAIDTLTTLIIETVARGEHVTLQDIGRFDSRMWKGRPYKPPMSVDRQADKSTTYDVPSHRIPTFRPSSKFRKAVREATQ